MNLFCLLWCIMDHRGSIIHGINIGIISAGASYFVRNIGRVNILQHPRLGHDRANLLPGNWIEKPLYNIPHTIKDESARIDHNTVQSLRKIVLDTNEMDA